jgi:mxaJ protein
MRSLPIYVAVLSVVCANVADGTTHAHATLRVCADPDNLPFSNEQERGFENRVASLVARELGARVEYTWWPQRRGFLRKTLNAGSCDVVMALPAAMEVALTTQPYYRSSYAFVMQAGRHPGLTSLDDTRLHNLRIGVQLVGDDGANSPPAHALSRRGIVRNVVGFPVYHDPARIVTAVAAGEIDIAIAWGPLAGYYAAQQHPPLRVVPVAPQMDGPALPMAFDISMAVRWGDRTRRGMLDTIISKHRADIDAILAAYHVPRVDREGS